eukprot:scaffold1541_cov67-Phaeocystis_antarctica.AAC.2
MSEIQKRGRVRADGIERQISDGPTRATHSSEEADDVPRGREQVGPARRGLADEDCEAGEDLLNTLPLELQLHIANAVGERCDRAALALASPRVLGLAACCELPSYQGLEMSLAFHVLGGAIDEQLLRSYASRSEATPEGCEWLAGVDAAAGVLVVSGPFGQEPWHLKSGSTVGALLRRKQLSGVVCHYEGKEGAERLARCDLPCGQVKHFNREKGAFGVLVRCEQPSGEVQHFEGETCGVERLVRCELPSGVVRHYEGEKGAERMARREDPRSGTVQHYKGERDVEFEVRREDPSGAVQHYKGEKGAEYVVRREKPNGEVQHYEGERGAEHLVRIKLPSGAAGQYEGEKGAEHLVCFETSWGDVVHYEGEMNAEFMVRLEKPNGEVQHFDEGERGVERETDAAHRVIKPYASTANHRTASGIPYFMRHAFSVRFSPVKRPEPRSPSRREPGTLCDRLPGLTRGVERTSLKHHVFTYRSPHQSVEPPRPPASAPLSGGANGRGRGRSGGRHRGSVASAHRGTCEARDALVRAGRRVISGGDPRVLLGRRDLRGKQGRYGRPARASLPNGRGWRAQAGGRPELDLALTGRTGGRTSRSLWAAVFHTGELPLRRRAQARARAGRTAASASR